jgi:NAD(P)-dependent dehydrogenase (short-subunit alcohol dehydrogenase family)
MGLRTYARAVALVTGGASGIGRALSAELAQRGATVVLADLQDELAESAADDIRRAGGSARAERLEVADTHAFESLVAGIFTREGRLDYVFNNAGIGVGGLFEHQTAEDFSRIVAVNLTGVLNGVRAVWPRFLAQGFGHVVNTASVAGLTATPFASTYAMTKHAVVGLSRALRSEGERRGVRVSALCPGAIRTPILTGGVFGAIRAPVTADRLLTWWERLRPMDPRDFAGAALDRVARNEGIIIIPRWMELVMRVMALSPALGEWLARLQISDAEKNYPEIFEPPR